MINVPTNDAFGGPTCGQDLHGGTPSNNSSSGRPKHVSSKHRPQHQRHEHGGGGSSCTTGKSIGNGSFIEAYDPDFLNVVTLPVDKVTHTPNSSLGVSRLVLCRNFLTDTPGQCIKGSSCKFVHADAAGCKRHPIHVNYAWRFLDAVTYQRLPAGETLNVSAPNERPPVDDIPSERILVTRGALMRHEHAGPLSHCAHYYFNRMCNRGERCSFIHAVVIDPNAQDLQRAPAPNSVAPLSKLPQHGKRTTTTSVPLASNPTTPGGTPSVEGSPPQLVQPMLMGLAAHDSPSKLPGTLSVPGMQPSTFFYAQAPPMMLAHPQPPPVPQLQPQQAPPPQQQQQQQSMPAPGMIFFPHMLPPGTVYYVPNSAAPVQPALTSLSSNAVPAAPSMTSLFVVQPGTSTPPMFPVNPLDWSFHGSIHNNASMSHSTSGVASMGSVETHYQPM